MRATELASAVLSPASGSSLGDLRRYLQAAVREAGGMLWVVKDYYELSRVAMGWNSFAGLPMKDDHECSSRNNFEGLAFQTVDPEGALPEPPAKVPLFEEAKPEEPGEPWEVPAFLVVAMTSPEAWASIQMQWYSKQFGEQQRRLGEMALVGAVGRQFYPTGSDVARWRLHPSFREDGTPNPPSQDVKSVPFALSRGRSKVVYDGTSRVLVLMQCVGPVGVMVPSLGLLGKFVRFGQAGLVSRTFSAAMRELVKHRASMPKVASAMHLGHAKAAVSSPLGEGVFSKAERKKNVLVHAADLEHHIKTQEAALANNREAAGAMKAHPVVGVLEGFKQAKTLGLIEDGWMTEGKQIVVRFAPLEFEYKGKVWRLPTVTAAINPMNSLAVSFKASENYHAAYCKKTGDEVYPSRWHPHINGGKPCLGPILKQQLPALWQTNPCEYLRALRGFLLTWNPGDSQSWDLFKAAKTVGVVEAQPTGPPAVGVPIEQTEPTNEQGEEEA